MPPPDLYIRQLELGPMANYVYLIGDPATKQAAVVDAAWDVPAVLRAAEEDGYRIAMALVTHGHHDHVNGLGALLRERDVPVYGHKGDAHALAAAGDALKLVSGGERVRLGEKELVFLHTPGHTEGSQCFLVEGKVVTGDTLFLGTCGRVDLPGSDPEKMYRSLRRLSELSDETLILPGHNYSEDKSAPMGEERGRNRFIQASLRLSPKEFRELTTGP